jgi:uncharacterized membrane protein
MHLQSKSSSSDDQGSASAEFVLLAIPLFIPVILFLIAINTLATHEMEAENLSRQSLRAFVSAQSAKEAEMRVSQILGQYSKLSGSRGDFEYAVSCSKSNCFEPGTLVEIKVRKNYSLELGFGLSKTMLVSATARGVVDRWRL